MSEILEQINEDFKNKGYRLSDTHYENGKSLHSDQYFFAKKFLQNSENCDKLSLLLKEKIEELDFPESTTFICYRTYLGLLLKKTIPLLEPKKYNFEIIDQINDDFEWQKKPEKNIKNLVVILPISCTCATYFKIKRFLTNYFKGEDSVNINDNFISIFLIVDQYLFQRSNDEITIEKFSKSTNDDEIRIFKLYKNFNWKKITPKQIHFYSENNTANKTNEKLIRPAANPIVKLCSNLHLPESCPICFPKDLTKEKPLFPTHETFETPSLIFDFPNFKNFQNNNSFYDLFYEEEGKWNIQLYGNRNINNATYISYIRGNEFYKKNKPKILLHFKEKIKNLIGDCATIVFITSENKKNSSFLEDFSNEAVFHNKKVAILRFQPKFEFIDNFISLYSDVFEDEDTKIIYFEEVITAGNTFKLVSDYIKHLKNKNQKQDKNKSSDDEIRHGFDMVLTLIDRTSWHTYKEIIRKLNTEKKLPDAEIFISFYNLNVPIIHSEHIGDPIKKRLESLIKLKDYCCLDYLKLTINNQIAKHDSTNNPYVENERHSKLNYFPFASIHKKTENEVFELYKQFDYERLNLIKLFLAHEINCLLADEKYQDKNYFEEFKSNPADFIQDIIDEIMKRKGDEVRDFFVLEANRDSSLRKGEVETLIVEEIIIKILSSPPFTYYKNIYNAIFEFCVFQADTILRRYLTEKEKNPESGNYMLFRDFRRFKFFIRLTVDLNSNFIVSEKFITLLSHFFDTDLQLLNQKYENYKVELAKKVENNEISKEYYVMANQQIKYILHQINSFFSYLLFCYKDLVFKNSYRSIKLEELINSEQLLPKQLKNPNKDEDISKLILDNYYQFTGMIKAENVIIIKEMIDYMNKNESMEHLIKNLKEKTPKAIERKEILDKIKSTYFFNKKNDSYFANVNHFMEKSRFLNEPKPHKLHKDGITKNNLKKFYDVRQSLCKAIYSAYELNKKISYSTKAENSLDEEIKKMLDDFMDIINHKETQYEYTLLIEYRKKQKNEVGTNNIFAITSEEKKHKESVKIGSIVNLNPNGLIYNLLYGLYDETNESRNLQTLVSCAKTTAGKMVAYKDHYYNESNTKLKFEDLYKLDLYNYKNDEGLKMMNSAQMAIFIRLTDFNDTIHDENKTRAEALLVITSKQESTIPNYLDFMSNEKIRLLLVLKDMLLKYLQKQFDNDTFTEIIKNRSTENYRKSLRHGIDDYTNSICDIIDNISSDLDNKFSHDLDVLNTIIEAIKGQLMTMKNHKSQPVTITAKELKDKINLIFNSYFFKYSVSLKHVKLNFNFNSIKLSAAVLNVALPEIIINMKKYTTRCGGHDFHISFDQKNHRFIFSNYYEAIDDQLDVEDHKGGLWMIKNILKENQLGEISWDSKDHYFETILTLNPEKYEAT